MGEIKTNETHLARKIKIGWMTYYASGPNKSLSSRVTHALSWVRVGPASAAMWQCRHVSTVRVPRQTNPFLKLFPTFKNPEKSK